MGPAFRVCVALAPAVLSACASYQPQPISPSANARAFDARTLDDPRLRGFIALASGSDGARGPVSKWDLPALTLAAIYYHPDLDIARAKLAAARAGIATARQVPNPSLGVGLTYNASVATPSPWTIGPVVDFLLETAGRREYRTAQARALTEAARQDLASAGWQVRGRVRGALIDLWAAGQRLDLARERLDLQDRLAGLLERRFAAGAASGLDVARERVGRDQANLALHDAERRSVEARARLAAAIGVPARALDREPLALDAFDTAVALDARAANGEWRRQALLRRSDVQGLLAEYEAAQSALQLQVASQFPNLRLGTGFRYDQGAHKYDLNVAAELPVFNQNQGPIAEAEARRAEAAARFTALQARIIAAVDGAAAGYRAAGEGVAAADALVEGAQSRERRIGRSFQAGAIGRPTLLAARIELAAIRLSRLDALVRLRQALGALEDALEQPLLDPGQRPPVPERSPRASDTEPSS